MALTRHELPADVAEVFRRGAVIPAHPLALDASRKLDRRRQRALTRYYVDAGAGGLAVGVHTTQFAIRDNGMFVPVLQAAIEDARDWTDRPLVMIAGVAGSTEQALEEGSNARDLGYHAALVSLAALKGWNNAELLEHCRRIADEIRIIGFYMQPAVGGVDLDFEFWREFAAIDNVIGIKVAPFNRYRTLDVFRGVVAAGAEDRITLYTGNDDHIVADLMTPFEIPRGNEIVTLRFRGGLLGHWSVWSKAAVDLLSRIHTDQTSGKHIDPQLLGMDARVTDCNSAFFDVANGFDGCIAGCHEVLRRQGLLEGIWCLDPEEGLSPGQAIEIDRVYADHPDLNDDDFVKANLDRWLS